MGGATWGFMMRSAIFSLLLLGPAIAYSATVVIDFENVVSDADAALSVSPYTEDGMQVAANLGNGIFGKDYVGGGIPTGDNDNGSAIYGWCGYRFSAPYLCDGTSIVTLTEASGNTFDLLSLDSSNLNLGELAGTLVVIGHLEGGGTINADLVLQSDSWQRFSFDASWQGLESVSIHAANIVGWDPAIDNIAVNVVPIPAAVWLFGSALASLGFVRRRVS
jgi:hypothetical protein